MTLFQIHTEKLRIGDVPALEFDNWARPVYFLNQEFHVLRKDPPILRIHLPEVEFTGVNRKGCLLGILRAAQSLCMAAETEGLIHIMVRADYTMKSDNPKRDTHVLRITMMFAEMRLEDLPGKQPFAVGFPSAIDTEFDGRQLRESLVVAEIMEG